MKRVKVFTVNISHAPDADNRIRLASFDSDINNFCINLSDSTPVEVSFIQTSCGTDKNGFTQITAIVKYG